MFRVCILASGSKGNCTYIESGGDAILIDAGISRRSIQERMDAQHLDFSKVRAVCITHEHDDHIKGVRVLHQRHGIPVFANRGTVEGMRDAALRTLPWNIFSNGHVFRIANFEILPFSLSHDAYDPVGFVVHIGPHKIGIATDLGIPTQLVRERLSGCHLLVLEANHDEAILKESGRPWHIIQRILGTQGHLSNSTTAQLLLDVAGDQLRHVFLAHISQECNCKQVALKTVEKSLADNGLAHISLHLTHSEKPSALLDWNDFAS